MFENNNFTSVSITTGTMIRAVLVILAFLLIWLLRDLVLIILTSIVIASFVESAVLRMKKHGIGRVFGVVLMYVIGLSFLATIFYLFAPLLITEIYNFSTFIAVYFPDVGFLNFFQSSAFSGAKDIVNNLSGHLSLGDLLTTSRAFMSSLAGGFFQTLSVIFGSIFNVFMIIIISFYLSIQEKGIENLLRIIIPSKREEYAVDLWERSRRKIALWIKGQLLLGLLVGVLVYLVLALLGVQYALLMAIFTAFLELIPYGFLVAMVPAIAIAYLTGGLESSLMVAGAFFIIHQFEVYLLAPLIVRKVVGLSPLVVIIAVLAGFNLAGAWGLILAIPVAVFFMEFLGDMEKNKIFSKTNHETK